MHKPCVLLLLFYLLLLLLLFTLFIYYCGCDYAVSDLSDGVLAHQRDRHCECLHFFSYRRLVVFRTRL